MDYAGIHRFRFTGSTHSHNDLHLPGFTRALSVDDVITVDLLKKKYAYAVDDDGHPVGDKWPVYKCIHLEVEDGDETFLLATGKWFRIRKTFTDEVNGFYDGIPSKELGWIEYAHPSEGDYNKAVFDSTGDTYALMDAIGIPVGGIRDKIDFCDLYSSKGELIHVKRYGASSLLGHLFNQGLVSGEHLRSDKNFLNAVNKKLPKSHKLAIKDSIPRDVSGFSIVFAIISEAEEQALHIPFFAKVAFKHACTRLRSLGYVDIAKAKVTVNDMFRKTEKPKIGTKAKKKKQASEPSNIPDEPAQAQPAKKTVFKSKEA